MTKYNCKTGKETKLFAAKQGPHPPQTMGTTINNESTTTEPKP